MGKHIHLYSTEQEFEADYNGTGYTEPWVSLTLDVDRVDYNKGDEPGPIVCDYYLVYDMEDYQTGVSNCTMFSPPSSYYTRGGKIWTPVDGDIDMSILNPSDLPVNIAVTINNLGTHGNNVTRAWTFPAMQDWTTTCGFPFTAEDFGEEPGNNEVWGVGYGSGPEFLVGIFAVSMG